MIPVRRWLAAFALVAMALLVATSVTSQPGPRAEAGPRAGLRAYTLEVPGRILGATVTDLSGAGKPDVVVAWLPEGPDPLDKARTRKLAVFRHRDEEPLFARQPDQTWSLRRDACCLLAADLNAAPGDEILVLCPDGLHSVAPGQRASEVVVSEPSFFSFSSDATLDHWPLGLDLDGDGRDEIILPTPSGYAVWGRKNGEAARLTRRGEIRLQAQERFAPRFEQRFLSRLLTRISYLPCVVAGDENADGRLDLISIDGRGLLVFRQRPDGSFPADPDLVGQLSGLQGDAAAGGNGRQSGAMLETVRVVVEDIDGDGRLDVLASRSGGPTGLLSDMRTRFMVFMGRRDGWFGRQRPDRLLSLRGLSVNPSLVDCDGDGKLDLVASSLRTDMLANLKRALVNSVTVTYVVFRGTGDGRIFDSEPFFQRDVEIPMDHLDAGGSAPLLFFNGDFDGDGQHDLLELTMPAGISWTPLILEHGFFGWGREELVPDDSRRVTATIPISSRVRVVDVNADGRDDILISYPRQDDPERSRLRILVSPGP